MQLKNVLYGFFYPKYEVPIDTPIDNRFGVYAKTSFELGELVIGIT
jgi:hypothetical protein